LFFTPNKASGICLICVFLNDQETRLCSSLPSELESQLAFKSALAEYDLQEALG